MALALLGEEYAPTYLSMAFGVSQLWLQTALGKCSCFPSDTSTLKEDELKIKLYYLLGQLSVRVGQTTSA